MIQEKIKKAVSLAGSIMLAAKRQIDNEFHDGYAELHPELLITQIESIHKVMKYEDDE